MEPSFDLVRGASCCRILRENEGGFVDGGEAAKAAAAAAAAFSATETAAGPRNIDGAGGAETRAPESKAELVPHTFFTEEM